HSSLLLFNPPPAARQSDPRQPAGRSRLSAPSQGSTDPAWLASFALYGLGRGWRKVSRSCQSLNVQEDLARGEAQEGLGVGLGCFVCQVDQAAVQVSVIDMVVLPDGAVRRVSLMDAWDKI